MSAIDYKTTIYDRIWTVLQNRAGLVALIKPGNRIDLTTDGWLRARAHRASADYPQLRLESSNFTNSGFLKDQTFEFESATFANDGAQWQVHRTLQFKLGIISDSLKIGDADPVEEQVQLALLAAGPRLGLPYVLSWGPMTGKQAYASEGEAKKTVRLVTELQFQVTIVLAGQQLIQQA